MNNTPNEEQTYQAKFYKPPCRYFENIEKPNYPTVNNMMIVSL